MEHTRRWPLDLVGVVGLLELGVVDRLEFCAFGLLESEPERKSGNRCGETDRLSKNETDRLSGLQQTYLHCMRAGIRL